MAKLEQQCGNNVVRYVVRLVLAIPKAMAALLRIPGLPHVAQYGRC